MHLGCAPSPPLPLSQLLYMVNVFLFHPAVFILETQQSPAALDSDKVFHTPCFPPALHPHPPPTPYLYPSLTSRILVGLCFL